MAQIGARGSVGLFAMDGGSPQGDTEISRHTAAGWHIGWWGISVIIIAFFLWAL